MKSHIFAINNRFVKSLCIAVIFFSCSCVFSQNYPNKPVKLIVPFAPGGGADIVARAISQPMAQLLGQAVVIENKPGGGGTLAADYVAKSAPDGYTLLYTTPGPQMTNPYLMDRLPYN
ncbi:MAG: tripartite tricarboxylate transporter substrate-binding protein, partial [Betaproteobacteria bacterium]